MASKNLVIILGNLGSDPELKRTQSGKAVATLSVATNEKRDGKDHVEWHRVIVWEKTAEACEKYLKKGSAVLVEGRLATRSWDDKGQKKYTTEIIANNVQFLGGRSGSERVTAGAETSGFDEPPF